MMSNRVFIVLWADLFVNSKRVMIFGFATDVNDLIGMCVCGLKNGGGCP